MKGLQVQINIWEDNESLLLQEVSIYWPFDIPPQIGMILNLHKADIMTTDAFTNVNCGMVTIKSIILHHIRKTITYELQCIR